MQSFCMLKKKHKELDQEVVHGRHTTRIFWFFFKKERERERLVSFLVDFFFDNIAVLQVLYKDWKTSRFAFLKKIVGQKWKIKEFDQEVVHGCYTTCTFWFLIFFFWEREIDWIALQFCKDCSNIGKHQGLRSWKDCNFCKVRFCKDCTMKHQDCIFGKTVQQIQSRWLHLCKEVKTVRSIIEKHQVCIFQRLFCNCKA